MKKEAILKFYLTYRLFIIPAFAVLSSLILIILVIYPQTMKLFGNQQVQQEIEHRLSFLETKAQALENYDQGDLNNKVSYALSAYPTDKDFAQVVDLLQKLTAQSGFNISSLSLGPGSGKDAKVQNYSIKLELLGSVTFIPILLSNIEHSPRLMRVSSIETTIGRDAQLSTVSLNIDALYASAPSGFGSVDSPLPELTEKDQEVLATLASSAGPLSQPEATSGASPRGKENPFE